MSKLPTVEEFAQHAERHPLEIRDRTCGQWLVRWSKWDTGGEGHGLPGFVYVAVVNNEIVMLDPRVTVPYWTVRAVAPLDRERCERAIWVPVDKDGSPVSGHPLPDPEQQKIVAELDWHFTAMGDDCPLPWSVVAGLDGHTLRASQGHCVWGKERWEFVAALVNAWPAIRARLKGEA